MLRTAAPIVTASRCARIIRGTISSENGATRRSAPRDYIFERPVFLAKMRMGQDLANIGARAPAEQESPQPAGAATPAASPAPQGGAPAPGAAPSGASPSPAGYRRVHSPPPAGSPGTQGAAISSSPPPGGSPTSPGSPTVSPAATATSPAPDASPIPKPTAPAPPAGSPPASPAAPVAAAGSPAATPAPWPEVTTGEPPMYSAAWTSCSSLFAAQHQRRFGHAILSLSLSNPPH